ncbi:small ribosomal subunit protein uS10m [Neodiprion pinetum]|uniref:Small ribosomal subunit protein uS10m n=1 Tax=Neodiprion lecontei TaxID=441921 RepID=A0A6J0BIW4_NEOLC|nr:28S ribosomal protein S10, mitochondrial [Neodiprion lecontei]XP_046477071.1 28S ribosomal protein S10, mitochondrial [Neodiprion pinetum]
MLYSKTALVFRNVLPKLGLETTSGILGRALSTQSQQSIETAIPDKLYKQIQLEVRGNDPAVLKSYAHFTVSAAEKLGATIGRNFAPRKPEHKRYTLLKCVHIFKKHRVQYEIRTYYRFIDLHRLTGSTADTILEYIQRNLPEGVAMKVTKVEMLPLLESIRVPPNSASTTSTN